MASLRDTLANLVEQYKASDTPLANLMRGDTEGAKKSAANAFEGMTKDPYAGLNVATPVGIAGTFIGPKSKLWNIDTHNLAKALESKGIAPEEIWKQTGNVKAPDNMWRQEISDVPAKITDNVYEGIKANQRFEGPMSSALEHDELYKAYPDVGNIKTGMYAWKTPEGSYHPQTRTITSGGPGTTSQKSAALHEIMHDIQQTEGFAKGGSPDFAGDLGLNKENQFNWAKKAYEKSNPNDGGMSDNELLSKLFDKPIVNTSSKSWETLSERDKLNWLDEGRQMAYRRLPGEAEARLVQRRMSLSPEERLQNFPYAEGKFGLDVPYKELLVKELLNK